VRFDPSHLHQVLWNLCSNACIHGTFAGQPPRLRVAAGLDTLFNMPYIDVHDFGQGIPESEVKKIFEPFFTTKAQGTGLGLYISREICEANGAQLQYLRPSEGGSCFRIMFAKPINQEKEPQWTLATP
jgi:two-component system sensor histidine kinase PilS (NtrC family)